MMEEETITKQIKIEQEDDIISLLPDCLLVEILSRLPDTKYAIRTGVLAKRWQHLWTFVHNLILTNPYIDFPSDERTLCFLSFVDKTLTQCRHVNINKFEVHLYNGYDTQFESQVRDWFRFAITCNVKDLNMQLLNRDFLSEFVLEEDYIFINSYFTHLSLGGCVFGFTGAVSWIKLETLCISSAYLDERMIENILSGCPVLETLTLSGCYGYSRLDITSKSVKNLVFTSYVNPTLDNGLEVLHAHIIEINAPNILSLTIEHPLFLWKMSLLNVSSLVKADLNYIKCGYHETTREESREEMLKGFILSLLHVKALKIGCHPEHFPLGVYNRRIRRVSGWHTAQLDVTARPGPLTTN